MMFVMKMMMLDPVNPVLRVRSEAESKVLHLLEHIKMK